MLSLEKNPIAKNQSQCNKIFNELLQSIILPLSQGSSELFHSNLLHYLAENEPVFFTSVLNGVGIDIQDYKSVRREYKHTDLSFFDVDIDENADERDIPNPILIVENKMKSLPTEDQAKNYKNKLFKTTKGNGDKKACLVFLLPFSDYAEKLSNYKVITYKSLGNMMIANIDKVNHNEFLRNLVNKYSEFVINLNDALDLMTAELDITNTKVGQYFDTNGIIIKKFHELRLSSIVWKLRMSFLGEELKKRLNNGNFKIFDTYKEFSDSSDLNRIYIGISISNAKPIVECFMYLNEEIEYFIQLDNGVYNHGIILKGSAGEAIKLIKDKAKKDKAKKELIGSVQNDFVKTIIDRLEISGPENKRKILSYNNMFYNHGDDVKEMTLSDVLDKIVEEVTNINTEYKYNKSNQL